MEEPDNKNQQKNERNIAVIFNDITYIKEAMRRIEDRFDLMNDHYVKKEEFESLRGDMHQHFLDDATFHSQIKTWMIVAGAAWIFIQGVFFAVFKGKI